MGKKSKKQPAKSVVQAPHGEAMHVRVHSKIALDEALSAEGESAKHCNPQRSDLSLCA